VTLFCGVDAGFRHALELFWYLYSDFLNNF